MNNSMAVSRFRMSKMERSVFHGRVKTLTTSKLIQNNYFASETKSQSLHRLSTLSKDHLEYLQNYHCEWNWSHFLEFLLYHLVSTSHILS